MYNGLKSLFCLGIIIKSIIVNYDDEILPNVFKTLYFTLSIKTYTRNNSHINIIMLFSGKMSELKSKYRL